MAQLQFLQNAGLNVTQEHTIHFQSENAQDTFWSARVITTADVGDQNILSRVLEETPVAYGKPKQELLGINYCRLLQDGKWWYFFIVNKKYINDNTTNLTMKLDVLQTFLIGIDYSIAESFVEREHQDRIDILQNRIYNVEPESVGYGSKYKLISGSRIYPADDQGSRDVFNLSPLYFACITGTDWLTNKGIPQYNPFSQLETLIVPFVAKQYLIGHNYKVSSWNDQTQIYNVMTLSQIFDKLIKGMNNIVSVTVLPYYMGAVGVAVDASNTTYFVKGQGFGKVTIDNVDYGIMLPQATYGVSYIDSIANPSNINELPSKNNLKNIKFESKLFTYPYYYHQMTDHNSEPQTFRNEYCPKQMDIYHQTSFEGIIKDKTGIEGYSLLPQATYSADQEQFIRINNMELPLTSDAWINYYNNNKASVQTGVLAQIGQGILGAGTQIVSGALGGNPLAVFGAIQTGISTIGSITSTLQKQSDLKNSPDTVRNVGNGAQYYISNDMVYFRLFTYSITDEFREKLFEYFYRYGYATKTFKVPDINTRYYFNYLQTIGANIVSNIDNEYITEIKGILDRGVTFWHYRDAQTWKGIENYEYENAELTLDGGV